MLTIVLRRVKVYPGGWTAVFISLDNPGVWNIRAENLDRWYLGQETYMRTVNPEENGKAEMAPPDNVLYCGALASLQKYGIPPILLYFSQNFMVHDSLYNFLNFLQALAALSCELYHTWEFKATLDNSDGPLSFFFHSLLINLFFFFGGIDG